MCAGDLRGGQVQGRSTRGLSFKNLMCAGCAPAFFGPGPGLLLPLLLLELRLLLLLLPRLLQLLPVLLHLLPILAELPSNSRH